MTVKNSRFFPLVTFWLLSNAELFTSEAASSFTRAQLFVCSLRPKRRYPKRVDDLEKIAEKIATPLTAIIAMILGVAIVLAPALTVISPAIGAYIVAEHSHSTLLGILLGCGGIVYYFAERNNDESRLKLGRYLLLGGYVAFIFYAAMTIFELFAS